MYCSAKMDENKITTLVFYLNGKKVTDPSPNPEATLLQYVRDAGLTGSKLGCAEGGCGACTVMVSSIDRAGNQINHIPVNACLAPVCSVHGLAVTTVEGIGSTKTRLHPVQERIAQSFGTQCGFCTPGIVMSMYTLLRNNPTPTDAQIENAFEGNLCRCTGYRPILEGFKSFSKDYGCGKGDKCCKKIKLNGDISNDSPSSLQQVEYEKYDPSQELIFPSELQISDKYDKEYVLFQSERVAWHRPSSLSQLLFLKEKYPQARLVVGNTEVGVETKFKHQLYSVLIAPTHVPELRQISHKETGIQFGAAVTLTSIESVLQKEIDTQKAWKTRTFTSVIEILRWFAGHQVRSVACLGGNIATASPISDMNPVLLAAGCELTLSSKARGERKVKMDSEFFCGYRKTAIQPDEIIISIHIPYTTQDEYIYAYKQAHRREDDIAIVNAGLSVRFEQNSNKIQEIRLAFGGMAPFTKMATGTMKALVGKQWNDDLVDEACAALAEDLPLPLGTPGGMESYRRTLTTSFFYKFFISVQDQLNRQKINADAVSAKEANVIGYYDREPSHGVQIYEESDGKAAVGKGVIHAAAAKQATGEAMYTDDIKPISGELYFAPLASSKAHANIVSIDWSAALNMPGVVDKIDASDVPGNNMKGHSGVADEEIFATKEVLTVGQLIGGIIAKTYAQAQAAVRAVKVTYEELPHIITTLEAIKAKSYHGEPMLIENSDVSEGFKQCENIHEGEFSMGGQEHFYLETHACIARPTGEDGEMEVYSSTQNPTEAQLLIASALAVPSNHINVRVKRLGGGFGGKESRYATVTLPVCIAAHKLGCAIRCMLDRDEDMVMTGTRHPFHAKYKVGFDNVGKIKSLDVNLYSNAGYSFDLSKAVMERAMFHIDNAYKVPYLRVRGFLCKTNTPSNTAFRGFGGPQGMLAMENIMSEISTILGIPSDEVRCCNFYAEGDLTHYNAKILNFQVPHCWEQVMLSSEFASRKAAVEEFNSNSRWKKRGISAVPVKFGIAFTALFLNQAGALVNVYRDGSVLVSHSGIEMGQGLHTKMLQVASQVLGVDISKIHISETSTSTVPNTSPTAASAGSDLNGMAVMIACQTIMERLEPIRKAKPGAKWEEIVNAAYFDRVSLSATGFYKTPDIGYNWEKNSGDPFSYYTQGAAVSEVEIDCLTGDHTVLRTDIVMDVGKSLNPAIDIGQIEGGFVQGYGLYTLEEQRYTPSGVLLTRGPGFYKIPGFSDIPVTFNVSLLKNADNPKAVYSSKAIGEPPLFLASSVFFAIKEAIKDARREAGYVGYFRFNSPATAENIRMACCDKFTEQFVEPENQSYKPWFVRL